MARFSERIRHGVKKTAASDGVTGDADADAVEIERSAHEPDGFAAKRFADRVAERVTAQALRPRLAGALAALPEGDRDALLLAAVGDLGYEDIARALDIPTGTVGSRLNRARRRLRDALRLTDGFAAGTVWNSRQIESRWTDTAPNVLR